MLAQTGLPDNPGALHAVNLPPFLLLQVVSIMEIGHSAFSLQNTRQVWLEKADLAGLAGGEDDGDEPAGEFPRYPRGMLSLELSDGYSVIKAIEYKRLDALKLGQTPLGYKIVLKNVPVRRGVAMLQPANVELRGCSNEELNAERETVFMRGLRARMGLPAEDEQNERDPQAAPRPNEHRRQDGPVPAASPPVPARAAGQRAPPPSTPRTQAARDPSISPYFRGDRGGPSVPLPPLPAQTRLQDQLPTDDSIDFDDDMDDSFLRQVDMVERQATSQGNRSHSRAAHAGGEVIAITDSEEEDKENIPMPQRKRPRRGGSPEVIELSD